MGDINRVRSLLWRLDRNPDKLTTAEEDTLLFRALQAGIETDRVTATLARHHIKLCWQAARKYAPHQSVDDCLGAAMEGLLMAIRRFDPDRGCRFSTYAVPWVTMKARRWLSNQHTTIRVAEHMIGKATRVRRAYASMHQETGTEPTIDALANATGLSHENVQMALDVQFLQPSSLNEDNARDLPENMTPESALMMSHQYDALYAALDALPPVNRDIVIRTYGLDGNEPESMRDLSRRYGVSYQRIEQRINAARKLLAREIKRHESL